jgi:hypothetical protein
MVKVGAAVVVAAVKKQIIFGSYLVFFVSAAAARPLSLAAGNVAVQVDAVKAEAAAVV